MDGWMDGWHRHKYHPDYGRLTLSPDTVVYFPTSPTFFENDQLRFGLSSLNAALWTFLLII